MKKKGRKRNRSVRFEIFTAATMSNVSEKRRFTQDLNSATSQKTAFLKKKKKRIMLVLETVSAYLVVF
jgi:hypothetical protein